MEGGNSVGGRVFSAGFDCWFVNRHAVIAVACSQSVSPCGASRATDADVAGRGRAQSRAGRGKTKGKRGRERASEQQSGQTFVFSFFFFFSFLFLRVKYHNFCRSVVISFFLSFSLSFFSFNFPRQHGPSLIYVAFPDPTPVGSRSANRTSYTHRPASHT